MLTLLYKKYMIFCVIERIKVVNVNVGMHSILYDFILSKSEQLCMTEWKVQVEMCKTAYNEWKRKNVQFEIWGSHSDENDNVVLGSDAVWTHR
jgi:hypothetical protein